MKPNLLLYVGIALIFWGLGVMMMDKACTTDGASFGLLSTKGEG
jgi:hypothetical protein